MNIHAVPLYGDDPMVAEIHRICCKSFRENLAGPFEQVTLTDPHIEPPEAPRGGGQMLHDIFDQLYVLWREGHDVLYTDADTLCLRPVEVFGRFDKFMLFSETPAKPEGPLPGPYLNGGVKYLPACMSRDLWEWADRYYRQHDGRRWDFDQELYNRMFYKQSLWHHNGWSGLNWSPRYPCGRSAREAQIAHFYMTRDREACMATMQTWEQGGHINWEAFTQ